MTTFTDSIEAALRDYVIDGDPGSGPYSPSIADLRTLLVTMGDGSQFASHIEDLLNSADIATARDALDLGTASTPTFAGLDLSGDLVIDTNVFVVDVTTNRVGIGTAAPSVGLSVAVAALFSSTLDVTGAATFANNVDIDSGTFYVDATNNRVGIYTASPGVRLDVVGEARVTASGSVAALRVVQTGTGPLALFEDQASTDSSPFTILADGTVIVGHTASIDGSHSAAALHQVHRTDSTAASEVARWSSDANGPVINLDKSRGSSVGTRGGLSSNDRLGTINFGGDDGTNFIPAVQLIAEVDNVPGTNDMPGRFVVKITPNGSPTPQERLRISETGFVSLNGDTDTGLYSPAANELAFWSGGAEVFRIEENGVVTVGHSESVVASRAGSNITPAVQVHGDTQSLASVLVANWAAATGSDPILTFAKSMSGIIGTRGAVDVGDNLGIVVFDGDDGTNFTTAAAILGEVDGTVSNGIVPGRLVFYTANASGVVTERLRIDKTGLVTPGVDNAQSLGSGSLRWSQLFAGTNVIATSDATEKQWLGAFSDAELAVGNRILDNLGSFKWLQSIAEKGASARTHLGVTAQKVAMAFAAEGLDPAAYAAWCADPRDDGGIRYGIRGEQLLFLLVAALAKRVDDLETA